MNDKTEYSLPAMPSTTPVAPLPITNPYVDPYGVPLIPPPPPVQKRSKLLWVLVGSGFCVVVVLVGTLAYIIGGKSVPSPKPVTTATQKDAPTSVTQTLNTKSSPVTSNYTANSVLNDLADSGLKIEAASYGQSEASYLNEYYPLLDNRIKPSPNDQNLLSSATFYNCTTIIPPGCSNANSMPTPDWLGVFTSADAAGVAYQETTPLNSNLNANIGVAQSERCLVVGPSTNSPYFMSFLQNSCT